MYHMELRILDWVFSLVSSLVFAGAVYSVVPKKLLAKSGMLSLPIAAGLLYTALSLPLILGLVENWESQGFYFFMWGIPSYAPCFIAKLIWGQEAEVSDRLVVVYGLLYWVIMGLTVGILIDYVRRKNKQRSRGENDE